eukprot:g2708.t1
MRPISPDGPIAISMNVRSLRGDKTGTVKFFDPQRGFGFIQSEGQDYFVHYSGIKSEGFRSLADGEEVEFNLEEDAKSGKKQCVEVTGIGGAPVRGSPRRDAE